ncbi:hypothetical protein ABZX85_10570 [Streptomyces sp. NPDC004539]|uniref:hypothetical protein n=1 Tax=Streptomyces sp. NPDC004539 TaxID=3154280 RepID=UPI0033BCD1F1
MSGEREGCEEWGGGPGDGETEEWVRELLAEDAYAIRPSPVPYPAIRRRGVVERRKRVAAAGAVLVALGVVPVSAWVVTGVNGGKGADLTVAGPTTGPRETPARGTSPTGGGTSAPDRGSPAPDQYRLPADQSPSPESPTPPATPGQLLDGVTFEEAATGLEKCIAYDRETDSPAAYDRLGAADGYRIILAMHSTGDSNSPGDGTYVVAVKDLPRPTRLICTLRDDRAEGLNASISGSDETPSTPLTPDINSGRLYQQSVLDHGNWKLPFRWATIGTTTPAVTRVTAQYGDSAPVEATLDHGWYIASGTLDRQVTRAPHLKGYDSRGTLVYDSDTDDEYQSTLP